MRRTGKILLLGSMMLAPMTVVSRAQPFAVEVPPAPLTPVRIVHEKIHGVDIADPYRWLEGDAKGKPTAETTAWVDAQNARTRAVLDHLPGRAAIESRLRELMQITSVSAPRMEMNRYFHRRREGDQNQAVLYVRDNYDGQSRVILDPNSLDKAGLITLAWFTPSQNARLVAFGIYRSGDENSVCHILDVDSGKWLADEIDGKVEDVAWLPDSSGFFYHRLADVNNPYSGQIRFHHLGDNPHDDKLLFEQYKTGPLATTWGPFANISRDARWMTLGYWTSTKSNDLAVVDLDLWRRSGKFVPVDIAKGLDAKFDGEITGDTLLMQTTLNAPNGRVIAVDLDHPEQSRWREIIPEQRDASIDETSLARGVLAVKYLENAATRIRLFDLDGAHGRDLPLPGIGSASLHTNEDRTETFLEFESFNFPPSIYRVDLADGSSSLWDKPNVPVDPSSVVVDQITYSSKDAAQVSMFIVHGKGVKLDGNNPTVLSAYGGFGLSETPYFSATLFPLFEDGGIYAVANIRGGGEHGESWHTAGMLANKQNSFDDFIAAAQYLIDRKYTRPQRLAIVGASNGGLLMGAVLTQRPDLFSAVVSKVPLLDMLRYQSFLMARYWVPEYGSAENADQFSYLLKYSPYQNVKPGAKYPAVLFTAGEHDARVHPSHAMKMAALLQASTDSDPSIKPILLWVDRDAGHGMGKPLNLRIRDVTDSTLFIKWQLGVLKESSTNP
jgi:prolyl oligopeptidase